MPALFLYAITFLLAACSMLYELLIAQTFSFLAGNTVIRYSVTIGLYLGGMGLGALFCKKITAPADPRTSLVRVEAGLSIIGGLSALILHYAHALFCFLRLADRMLAGVVAFYSATFLLILCIGFLTGLELPLLIRMGTALAAGRITNRILGFDYFGSLAAAVAFPLVLLPYVEMVTLAFATAVCNLAVAVYIMRSAGQLKRQRVVAACILLASAGFCAGLYFHRGIQQTLLKRYYYHYQLADMSGRWNPVSFFKRGDALEDIERYNSRYQKIDIVHLPWTGDPFTPYLVTAYSTKFIHDPRFPQGYLMFLDGGFQLWTDYEEVYHEYFAHIPVIVNKSVPESVLVLGAGDGMLARELLKYKDIRKITLVELDSAVIELARTHPVLRYANKSSLDDPRVTVVVADAYYYLRHSLERFDAIYIDFPDPNTYELAKLFSAEFYRTVRSHLNPGGFAVLDAPGIDLFSIPDDPAEITGLPDYPLAAALNRGGALYARDEENCWEIFYQTLRSAGFGTIIPYCSNLEAENPQALRVLEALFADVETVSWMTTELHKADVTVYEDKRAMIRKHIQAYIDDLQMGFIMLKDAPEAVSLRYDDPGIRTYVLNEQRFYLAFTLPFSRASADSRLVNSILRPRFPKAPFWRIKTAL